MAAEKEAVDWSVYVVTDSRCTGGRPLARVVEAALRGGAGVVQYREKQAGTRTMVREAAALLEMCQAYGASFFVNDRIDVALAVGAHGVHLGQDDMPIAEARRLLGPRRIIGVTVHNAEEIRRAEAEGADVLSIAPVFATATKPDHQTPLGLDGLRRLAALCRGPVVAIAGITVERAPDVIRAGVDGVCVVSAVMAAPDPEAATRELRRRVEEAKAERAQ
ncbi:thiamine-phosphate diphosphorylase [Desulfacinum hydrothermale DSM 13146]|uniref:Thiamine-phosphate synthase n=1 Tax=Desulfacinum hydrothermale DSM 13146 TaxID=1121390 RepID=A0A1W1XUN2_9BACT|nr:thiamine phosphate synthase [Desulfacinum hydrothermale]SMC27690.1 thiamine-phosphate diphosphorylase [Desulfacinum hydrothermale DSM 13146]